MVPWFGGPFVGKIPYVVPGLLAASRSAYAVGLSEIAHRLNRDVIATGQGGRQWWPSTVRAVLARFGPLQSARAGSVQDEVPVTHCSPISASASGVEAANQTFLLNHGAG
jgi:hypothetical protein